MKRFCRIVEKNDRQYLLRIFRDDDDHVKIETETTSNSGLRISIKIQLKDGIDYEKEILDNEEVVNGIVDEFPISPPF